MALTRDQYDTIMLHYEQKQSERRKLLESRRQEVYRAIPEMAELDRAVPRKAMDLLRGRLSGRKSVPGEDPFAAAENRRRLLMEAHGFPADYLDPPYSCPLCRDTGFEDGRKCRCFRQEEISILYDQSHIRLLASRQNFSVLSEEFYTGEDLARFRRAVRISRRLIENFDQEALNIYFFGTVGTGKSFLSVCIAHDILESGRSVLYFSAAALFDRLAALAYNYRDKEPYQTFITDLYHCDLLIIDDLGTELTNQFVSAQLFSCLNDRHLNRKSTIISSNLSLEELRHRYSDRISSRITAEFEICRLSGRDIRLLKKVRSKNGTNPET